MVLKSNFDQAAFRRRFADVKGQIDAYLLNALSYLGETCVALARTNGSYIDQTGNLRASVGYVVVHNGTVVKTSFGKLAGSAKGNATGLQVARQAAADYPTGWVLIVVAGMAYAAKVESRGRDVLTSAQLYAEAEAPDLLAKLKTAVTKLASQA